MPNPKPRSTEEDDKYMLCLRENVLQVADALSASNIEECRNALRSIALGLIPESKLREFGAMCCSPKGAK